MTKLPQESLSFILCEVLNLKYGSASYHQVLYDTMHYIVCHTNIKEYHKQLSTAVDFTELDITPSQFRISLTENAYVIKNLKYYCGFISMTQLLTQTRADDLANKYEVLKCDARWIYRIVSESRPFRSHIKTYARTKQLSVKQYSIDAYKGLSGEFASMLDPVMRHAKSNVYKKMRFITKYHNIAPSDFTSEIMCNVLKSFYQSKPNNMEPAHQINYLKSTTTSRILNMIDSFTSQKRQRLVNMGTDNKEGAKFVLTTTAESQLPMGVDGETQSLESMGEGEFWMNGADKQDFTLSLERLLEKYGNKKRGAVVRIFTGQEVVKFTEFLRTKRIIRTDNKTSQDIVSSKPRAEVKSLVAEYLAISESSIDRALEECYNDLGL